MPAYANKDGKVVCFFRDAGKFKERYAMFGFNDSAKLDDGSMWPVALLPLVSGTTAVVFGLGAGFGTRAGVKALKQGEGGVIVSRRY